MSAVIKNLTPWVQAIRTERISVASEARTVMVISAEAFVTSTTDGVKVIESTSGSASSYAYAGMASPIDIPTDTKTRASFLMITPKFYLILRELGEI